MKKILIIHSTYSKKGGEDIAVENEIELLKTKYDVESEIEMKELFAKCKGSKDKEKKD